MTVHSVSTLRVRYAETDQMGVVHHSNYFAWFEVGRTDLLRGLGRTYRDIEAQGIHLPVVDAEARYLKPAMYDDLVEIHTTLQELGRVRLRFAYEVRRAGDALVLATGRTGHAVIGENGRPARIPADLRQTLEGGSAASNSKETV